MADAAPTTVVPAPPMGMIALKGAAGSLGPAVQAAVGLELPAQRRITLLDGRGVAWMASDEVLLILPPDGVSRALSAIAEATAEGFASAADMSSARAGFRIIGPRAEEVLMKLCPVDVARMAPGEIRRSRTAQVAVAFWRDGDGFTLICFRSVADYVAEALATAARPEGAVFS